MQAVLYYRLDDKVMDLRSINVPKSHKGQGIARLLTETAFTYAILHNYYLYLTCAYTQNYFIANQNQALENRIAGPEELFTRIKRLDRSRFNEFKDPENKLPKK